MFQDGADLPSVCALPLDKLPEYWNDEQRMNVLFAPFRNRTVNPKDYETKLSFWKNLISVYCEHNKVYTFKAEELSKAFVKDGRPPSCLNVVIEELIKSRDLKPLHQFLEKTPETWSGWATHVFIKKPVIWSFNKLKSTIISSDLNNTFVHVPTVQSHANKLYGEMISEHKNKVFDITAVDAKSTYNENNLQLLLHSLVIQGKASIREINKNNQECVVLVKFGDVKKIGAITDLEVDVYVLEETEKNLSKNVHKLEVEITDIINQAKQHLKEGHKQTAKTCLRKKHEIEKRVSKTADTLFNIQTLLQRVYEANMNTQVLDTYKAAMEYLRKTFKENGLTEENVNNTMIELGEVLDTHEDIQNAMSLPVHDVDVDLEEELAELMKSDTGNNSSNGPKEKPIEDVIADDIKDMTLNLPDVPSSPPSVKNASLIM